MEIIVRPPKLTDRSAWQHLWQQYLAFYNAEDFETELTDNLWQRIHIVKHPINCLVAQNKANGDLIGFVHYLPHVDTWKKTDVCYLEDLFVNKDIRSNGVGEKLIKAVVEQASKNGWHHVYWKTKFDNKIARKLYDKLTRSTDGFVTYRLPVISKL